MMNDSSSSPRLWRIQFSMKLLLSAVTAFAIGFPIWYRWPYEEKLVEPKTGTVARITTWQRQWGGGRLQHGPQTHFQGPLVQSFHYRRGKAHGPYFLKNKDKTQEEGQYLDGQREGTWKVMAGDAALKVNWHRGKLDGPCEFIASGRTHVATFETGRLTQIDGQDVRDDLFDALQTAVIDERTRAELDKTTELSAIEMPLNDVIVYLSDAHNIPILLDVRRTPLDLPLTVAYRDIDLRAALALLSAVHGLACDCRFGCLWITSADRAADRRDPTGVADIKLPANSELAAVWNQPVQIDVVEIPLAEVVDFLGQSLGIEIDTTRIRPTPQSPGKIAVTHAIKQFPFRHVLGQLLYKTGCRCRLEGETLVILAPESKTE